MAKEFFREKAIDLLLWSGEELLAAIYWFSGCGLLTMLWYLYCSLSGAAFFTLTLLLLVESAGAAVDKDGYLILVLVTFLASYSTMLRWIYFDFEEWLARKEKALERRAAERRR